MALWCSFIALPPSRLIPSPRHRSRLLVPPSSLSPPFTTLIFTSRRFFLSGPYSPLFSARISLPLSSIRWHLSALACRWLVFLFCFALSVFRGPTFLPFLLLPIFLACGVLYFSLWLSPPPLIPALFLFLTSFARCSVLLSSALLSFFPYFPSLPSFGPLASLVFVRSRPHSFPLLFLSAPCPSCAAPALHILSFVWWLLFCLPSVLC